MSRWIVGIAVIGFAASASLADLSGNIIGCGDFEDPTGIKHGTGWHDPPPPSTFYDMCTGDSKGTQEEIDAGAEPIHSWAFHPPGITGILPGVPGYEGQVIDEFGMWIGAWSITVHDDPRSMYGIEPIAPNNRSEDPLNPGNHVMEGVSFRSHVGQFFRAPVNHVPGTATIDFDYYWNNWVDPPGPPNEAASIFHVWVWSFPEEDLPTWQDRAGPPHGGDPRIDPVTGGPGPLPNAHPIWTSPNWSEWGWAGWGEEEDPIPSLGNQWNNLATDHPERATFTIDTINPYYYICVWECVYAEGHTYFWMYDPDLPCDTFAIGIDNIEMSVQISVPGDFNPNGMANLLDINDFVLAITHWDDGPGSYMDTYPYAHLETIDPSQGAEAGDPFINLLDIPYFVDIITGGGGSPAVPIPEPATMGLIATGALALMRRRRA